MKNKNVKGITLIALVITIIVLLILAGVSIAMLTGENGILTQAKNAKDKTEIASEKEAVSLAYTTAYAKNNGEGKVTYGQMQDALDDNGAKAEASGNIIVYFPDTERYYTVKNGVVEGPFEEKPETELSAVEMFENGQNCDKQDGTCTDATHLHIGDYVEFQNPTSGKYDITSAMSGVNATQTYSVANNQNLNWRVLGIDVNEETGEKRLKLIAGSPMKLDNISGKDDPYLYLYGAWGYEYGIDAMDNAVSAIYGSLSNVAEARSVKIEDINEVTGVTSDSRIKEVNLDAYYGNKQYGDSYSYSNQYTPASWLQGQRTTVSGTINGYYYSINSSVESGAPYVAMDNTRAYNLLFNNVEYPTGAQYWLSSPGVYGYSSLAAFGPGLVGTGGGITIAGASNLFNSYAVSYDGYAAVRPVVILESGVSISKTADKTEDTWNYSGGNWKVETNDEIEGAN